MSNKNWNGSYNLQATTEGGEVVGDELISCYRRELKDKLREWAETIPNAAYAYAWHNSGVFNIETVKLEKVN